MKATLAIALSLLCATVARADDEDLGAPRDWTVSPEERAYGREIARRLGVLHAEASRAVVPGEVRAAQPGGIVTPEAGDGVGVDISLSGGMRVRRVTFPDARAAQAYVAALEQQPDGAEPFTAEVRGNQVITARGEQVRDPELAAAIRRAAWHGLTPPAKEVDATLTQVGDGAFAMTTRLSDGPIAERFQKALEAARRILAEPRPAAGLKALGPDGVRVELPSGVRAEVSRAPDGTWSAWSTRTPHEEKDATAHATAQAVAQRKTAGAAGVLDAAFKR